MHHKFVSPAPPSASDWVSKDARPKPFLLARLESCWWEAFVLDETGAYVSCQDGAVYTTPFGLPATRVAMGSMSSSHALASYGTWLFYMSNTREISAVPKQGGASTVFHKGLQAVAMQLDGVDLIVSAFHHGIVRIPIATAVPQMLVPVVSPRELAVGGGAIYFLDQAGEKLHLFQSVSPTAPSADLGEVSWLLKQLALAGDRLFDGQELELSTMKHHPLPQDCGAFVTDSRFVFATCSSWGVVGREITGTDWRPVAHVLVHDTLAVSATHVCWMKRHFDDKASSVHCAARPDGLR